MIVTREHHRMVVDALTVLSANRAATPSRRTWNLWATLSIALLRIARLYVHEFFH